MDASSLLAFNLAAASAAEALRPASIRVGPLGIARSAAPITCATSGARMEQQLAEDGAGLVDVLIATFSVRKSLLAEIPRTGDRLFWLESALAFRIARVVPGIDADPCIALHCVGISE